MISDKSLIEGRIEAERRSLGDNLRELEVRARAATDWRTYVSAQPWAALGLAVAGGALLSELGRSRSRPNVRAGGRSSGERPVAPQGSAPVDAAWEQIKAAAVVAAATQAAGLLRRALPGFHETFLGAMNGARPTGPSNGL